MNRLSTLFLKIFIVFLLAMTFLPSRAMGVALKTVILGVNGPVLQNIQNRLDILKTDTTTPDHFMKQAPQNIQKAIEPFGYFKASIQSYFNPATQTAYFTIHPGLPLRITRVDVQITGPGQLDPALQNFIQHFPVKPGQVFQVEPYNQAKENLFQLAHNSGYLKATLEKKEILIDLKNNTTVIILHLNTGTRYYYGHITFTQQAYSFSPDFLKRFMPFHEGDPFSSQQLLLFQENLSNSRYFRQVTVSPLLISQDETIPIHVALTANQSEQYKIGVGYGTFTGPRFTLGTDFHHLTRTGHYLTVQLKLSPVLSGLAAQYVIPGKNPLTDQYTLGANAQKFVPKNGESFSETLSMGHTKKIDSWKRTITLSYLRERYAIADQPYHDSRLLIPSLSFSRLHSDSVMTPHSGSKINFIIRGASDLLVSNTKFIQSELTGKFLWSPTESSHVILRGDVGYTVVDNIQLLPLSLQFFAGGLDSVRGFGYSSIGPGRYLKVGSIELQHRIIGDWYGAVFYDVGTADNHFNARLNRGTGVGIIYESLIGPVKLYITRTESTASKRLGIEFSIGPEL